MTDQNRDWRGKLQEWLKTHDKTMPDNLRQLREEFVRRFPKETLGDMTLQQYAGGKPDGFAYWLQYKTNVLGGMGGFPNRVGVYRGDKGQWHYAESRYRDENEAFIAIRAGIVEIIHKAETQNYEGLDSKENPLYSLRQLRGKILNLYFPEVFFQWFQMDHLRAYLRFFGDDDGSGDLVALNLRLVNRIRSFPQFADFDMQQVGGFLYECFPPESLPKGANTLNKSNKTVNAIRDAFERTKTIIVYGPPGTGKTFSVRAFANHFTDPSRVAFATFHQSFAYEEFIEGLKPYDVEGQVLYKVMDGIFKSISRTAEKNPNSKYLFIIDEINRANIAKVFGELITLIEDDKRSGQENALEAILPYSEERFSVPPNLYILGTMNTADRSIALLDLALRRRFTFVELMPDPSLLGTVSDVNLPALLTRLNQRVTALLDRDHQIGHSYLMSIKSTDKLRFVWYHRVVPLLQEYFYNDGERLKAVLGAAFVSEQKQDGKLFDAPPESFDADTPRYDIRQFDGDDQGFLDALRALSGVTTDMNETPA